VGDIDAIDGDFSGLWIEESQEQIDERGFSGAGGADDSDGGAGGDGEVEVFEDGLASGVAEGDVFETDFAGCGLGVERFLAAEDVDGGFEQVENAGGGGHGALVEIEGLPQACEGPE